MNNKISSILDKLNNAGYEAYIVGGFVRDYLLGIENYDIDIATNATPKEVSDIFNLNSSSDLNYGTVSVKDNLYNYDITTYRIEYSYENRKPSEYEYSKTIEEDINRRDFTINAIYMDSKGNLIDPLNGKDDLDNKVLKCVGDIKKKMTEDPLRMLRAIRFSSLLNFELDGYLYEFIKKNKNLIKTLSFTRKKEELERIFKNQNKLNGIGLIVDLGLEDVLGINIPKNIVYSDNPIGMWAQIKYDDEYPFTKDEIDKIENVKQIVNYAIIDNIVLFRYGLYISMIASEIIGMSKSYVSEIYANMPIYTSKDIVVNGDDLIDILDIEPGSIIKDIILDLELNILSGNIKNDYDEIKEYVIKNWS